MKRVLIAILLWSAVAHAQLSVVNKEKASADSNDVSIACPEMATSAGNLLDIFFRQSNNANLPDSVSNTGGDTWTGNGQANMDGANNDAITHYYAKNINGHAHDVITVHWPSNEQFRAITCFEIAGADTASPLDQVVTGRQGTASSITSPTFTTTQANEIIMAGIGTGSLDATYTADTGYTLGPTIPSKDASSEYKIVSSTQTGVTTSMSATGSDVPTNWGIVVATFKAAGGGPTGGTPRHRVIQ